MKSSRVFEPVIPNVLIGTGGDDRIVGESGVDHIWGFEGRDVLIGEGGNDVLMGAEGDDLLEGGEGDDALYGGAGGDLLTGGQGMDDFDGGEGADQVAFGVAGAIHGVIADLRTQTILNDGFGNTESMTSIEGFGSGTQWADVFYGDEQANTFWLGMGDAGFGFDGDDTFSVDSVLGGTTIDGGAGNDTIDYFTRSRWYNHGSWVEYQSTTRGVTVSLESQTIMDDGFGGWAQISGIENVGGSWGDDFLIGDTGANILTGFGGRDILRGNGGDDVLTGGEGGDEFQFIAGASGNDRITDFQHGADQLHFLGLADVKDFFDLGVGHDAAGNVVISWAEDSSVTLIGVTDVSASDFLFW